MTVLCERKKEKRVGGHRHQHHIRVSNTHAFQYFFIYWPLRSYIFLFIGL
jgi:hypothetical protein